jgi:hypothetical protein
LPPGHPATHTQPNPAAARGPDDQLDEVAGTVLARLSEIDPSQKRPHTSDDDEDGDGEPNSKEARPAAVHHKLEFDVRRCLCCCSDQQNTLVPHVAHRCGADARQYHRKLMRQLKQGPKVLLHVYCVRLRLSEPTYASKAIDKRFIAVCK